MCRRLQYSRIVLAKLISYPVVRVANITATIRSKSIILLAYPGIQYFAEVFFGGAVDWMACGLHDDEQLCNGRGHATVVLPYRY